MMDKKAASWEQVGKDIMSLFGKKEEPKSLVRDAATVLGPSAAALAVAGVSSKAGTDINSLMRKLRNANLNMADFGNVMAKDPGRIPVKDVEKIFQTYGRDAQDMLSHRILGIKNIPTKAMQTETVLSELPGMLNLNADARKTALGKMKGRLHHYSFMSDPSVIKPKNLAPSKALSHYMTEWGQQSSIGGWFNKALKDTKVWTPAAVNTLNDPSKSLLEKIIGIKKTSADPKTAINQFKLMVSEQAGRLAGRPQVGRHAKMLSSFNIYKSHLTPTLMKLRKVFKKGSKYSLYAAALLPLYGITKLTMDKTGASLYDDEDPMSISNILALLGAGGLGIAAKNTSKAPGRIGVTFGEMPEIGAGHKEPGRALFSELARHKDVRKGKFSLEGLRRNPEGYLEWVKANPKGGMASLTDEGVKWGGRVKNTNQPFSAMLDTGFGVHDADPTRMTHGYDINSGVNVMKGGRVSYQTDLLAKELGGQSFGTAARKPGVDKILTYGEHTEHHMNDFNDHVHRRLLGFLRGNVQELNVGNLPITPAVKPELVKLFRTPVNKPATMQSMANVARTQGLGKTADLMDDFMKKGKDLLIISGSGRGDHVALRALEVQKLIDSMPDKYGNIGVVALGADHLKYTPLAEVAEAHPRIATFRRLDPKNFVNAQRIGKMHWGSTGASSLAESLLNAVPTALIPDLNAIKQAEVTVGDALPGIKPQDWDNWFKPHLDLATWNRGGVQQVLKQKGIVGAQSADEVLNFMSNPDNFTADAVMGRAKRAKFFRVKARQASKNAANSIINTAKKTLFKHKAKRVAPLAILATALAGGGIYSAVKAHKKRTRTFGDKVQDIIGDIKSLTIG